MTKLASDDNSWFNSKKILVPYEGSPPAESALEHAVALSSALDNKGEIILLTVVQQIVMPPMIQAPHFRSKITGEELTVEGLTKELYHEMKAEAVKALEKKVQEIHDISSYKNLSIRTKVLVGHPADNIIEYATEEAVDLIIIGNVGYKGASKIRSLGSVSRAVAERASCPVMIVHYGAKQKTLRK